MSLYGILISFDHYEAFTEDLTPEGVGKVIIALMESYLFDKEPEELGAVEMIVFRYLKRQVDVSIEQHERRVEITRKAGRISAEMRKRKDDETNEPNMSQHELTDVNRCQHDLTDVDMSQRMSTEVGKNKNKNKDKDKNKNTKESGLDALMDRMDIADSVREAVRSFIEMRKAIKAPMTDRAIEMLLSKLIKMSQDETMQREILEQSIMRSWKGIFPLEDEKRGRPKKEVAPFFRQINNHDHNQDYNALISQMVKGGD